MTTEVAKFMQAVLAATAAGGTLPARDPPAVESIDQREAYDALAHQIYDRLEGPAEERARSPAGKLASTLWQRVADWDEHSATTRD